MNLIEIKKVLLLGPSSYALSDSDYSKIEQYDYIARTNKILESKQSCKTDILFINSNCVKFYLTKVEKLLGKIVFTKRESERNLLMQVEPRLHVYDLEQKWSHLMQLFSPHQPYYGTLIIDYLSDYCEEVGVAGIDFYYNGFSKKENYIEGYYDLGDLSKEDPQHSIIKDLKYVKFLLNKKTNINLLQKTKEVYEELISKI